MEKQGRILGRADCRNRKMRMKKKERFTTGDVAMRGGKQDRTERVSNRERAGGRGGGYVRSAFKWL